MTHSEADELITIRDILRFAVSRFQAEGLTFGQGTSDAVEEAVFLILETLHLPVEDVNPWADARLTRGERVRLLDLIEARIRTRRPAAYMLNKAYMHGESFYVDERVLIPRSFIGELLFSDLIGGGDMNLIDDADSVSSVLDLCTGSGCLAILAARVFPHAQVDAVDISADALAVAARNVADKGLEERIELFRGDLFSGVGKRRYDLIITNPPYVADVEMDALPEEFRAEPALALAGGGEVGMAIVTRILEEAAEHLTEGGGLMCEIGQARAAIEAMFPELPFVWLDTAGSQSEVFWITREGLGAL
jgi:ribosomal protein L3 glutamine methyltransferase